MVMGCDYFDCKHLKTDYLVVLMLCESMLLAAITTIFLAAEKQWMMLDWKTKRPYMFADLDPFGFFGRIVEDGFVFRQNFSVGSYEIGADRLKCVMMDGLKIDDSSSSVAPRTFINQLSDWSMLLAAITTVFLAAEKQCMMLDWKTKRPYMFADLDPFGFGRIVEDGFVFR
ncbi:hypothetical protein L1987_54051 [Smallanthus sonchifolius]|uniref:Uncharacterized protein n=1 Tax=Smallanthus sonchifolius TaxID=185202 RepID=A0ACB9E752_9ASTR|nr:hypothetical protein L1987_54051 [Smallanthus sonchifolius]